MTSTEHLTTLEVVQSLVGITAILVGGIWAFLKVHKARYFRSRLETAITGRFISIKDFSGIVFKISLKNVGLSKVMINRESSTVEVLVYPYGNYIPEFHNALVDRAGVVDAIRMHDWIEPSECITEERLIALPSNEPIAAILILRLLETPGFWLRRRGALWCSMTVVTRE